MGTVNSLDRKVNFKYKLSLILGVKCKQPALNKTTDNELPSSDINC